MWMLTNVHTGDKLYLVPEMHKYTVGRAGSNIVLKDDTSISRSHAILMYAADALRLEDVGSKYGTYYNENITNKTKMTKGISVELKEGDRILFGVLKNEWITSKIQNIAMSSALTNAQTTEMQTYLKSLGGKLIMKWEPSCTHLIMSEITITIKVLHALIEKIPIVSCEFWKEYLKNVKEQKSPPNVNSYLPKPSAQLSSAINVENFNFNERRKTLFAGKTFVFMSKKHYDMYSQIIRKAGGECKDLKSNTHKSFFMQKNVIIIQYFASTQSQGSQTVNAITEYLHAHSVRTIPEYEIGLAIVCCTTEKYCNPTYSMISHVIPLSPIKTPNIGTILAENTGCQKLEVNETEPMIIEIPDSECPPSTSSKNNVLESEVFEEKISALELISNDKCDILNCGGVVLNNTACDEKSTFKRRRKSNTEEECTASKKVHLSQDVIEGEHSVNTNSKEVFGMISAIEGCRKVIINSHQEASSNTKLTTKKNQSGFLQKSQTAVPVKDVSESKLEINKRGRIARITDNGSEDEDDIFNFGSPAKKSKRENCNSDDELFAFKNTNLLDTEDSEIKSSEKTLPNTQLFVAKRRTNNNIKISPVKPSSEGWLSKLNTLKIKTDIDTQNKIEGDDHDDFLKNEWMDSIKGGFEVRVRKMNLSTKGNVTFNAHSSSTTLNISKKNFKAFVKKNNYKRQTVIIQTNRR